MDQYNNINQVQNAYKNAALATNNIQHVVMLYNTVIKNLKLAKHCVLEIKWMQENRWWKNKPRHGNIDGKVNILNTQTFES